jgi:hypothetical protein
MGDKIFRHQELPGSKIPKLLASPLWALSTEISLAGASVFHSMVLLASVWMRRALVNAKPTAQLVDELASSSPGRD